MTQANTFPPDSSLGSSSTGPGADHVIVVRRRGLRWEVARDGVVRRMIDWLIEAFNPAKYPWFRDEFIHPRELKAVYMGAPLTHLFGGFSTEGR